MNDGLRIILHVVLTILWGNLIIFGIDPDGGIIHKISLSLGLMIATSQMYHQVLRVMNIIKE